MTEEIVKADQPQTDRSPRNSQTRANRVETTVYVRRTPSPRRVCSSLDP